MPPETNGDVAVVKPHYAIEEAYNMGYKRFEGAYDETGEFDFSGFTDSAEYANSVLPDLRAMAGFADHGHGTYQERRRVAATHPGCEEDEPAEADLMDAGALHSELADAYRKGAVDGAAGWEKEIPEANL